tara:strand:- start:114 stop:329 length:216 start_codon:yes stop_codon:yes gene_type:complete
MAKVRIKEKTRDLGTKMNRLTDKEINKLVELGKNIRLCLSCDINDTGLPCATDRFEAVELMKKYLRIHREI